MLFFEVYVPSVPWKADVVQSVLVDRTHEDKANQGLSYPRSLLLSRASLCGLSHSNRKNFLNS